MPTEKPNPPLESVRRAGLTLAVKVSLEPESGVIILRTRRPARIEDGYLRGTEIVLHDESTFRVWTDKTVLAVYIARAYPECRLVKMTGECDLYVPGSLADKILPRFGLRKIRKLTGEALERARANMKKVRESRRFISKSIDDLAPEGDPDDN